MFRKLTQFDYRRSTTEAIGFYLAYLLFLALIAGLITAVVARNFNESVVIGARIAVIVSPMISFFVLYKKKRLKNFGYLLLIVLSGILAMLLGLLLGLIPAAYLTTLESATNDFENQD